MHRTTSSLRVFAVTMALFSLLALSVGLAYGQAISGNLVGTVLDSSGAAVANAGVTATNVGTAQLIPGRTNSTGEFRFDNLAIELQGSPDATAYIIIYAGRTSRAGQAEMLGRRSLDYLTATRGVDAQRIVVINGGYRDTDFIEIWICPPGAKPPQPTPTVQPGEVQPAPERARPRKPRRRR